MAIDNNLGFRRLNYALTHDKNCSEKSHEYIKPFFSNSKNCKNQKNIPSKNTVWLKYLNQIAYT
jgi:hypothetical protein